MFLTIVEFAMVALGAKVLLAGAVIYCLLPADRRCAACDGETVLLRGWPVVGRAGRLLRLESRWCPHCGETALARRHAAQRPQPERLRGEVPGDMRKVS